MAARCGVPDVAGVGVDTAGLEPDRDVVAPAGDNGVTESSSVIRRGT